MTIGDIIERARQEMAARGYVRGARHAITGEVCALGALECALDNTYLDGWLEPGGSAEDHPDGVRAIEALSRHIPSDWRPDQWPWNERWDDDGRLKLNPSGRVAGYNNCTDAATVDEWFAKTAADEGITL